MFGLQDESNAQTLYRCGNAYQDRPCSTGEAKKVTGVAANDNAKNTPDVAHPSCKRLGAESLKIAWRREGGATFEQALSTAGNSSERSLVESVYRTRGTAPEIRARIENECVAEMEKRQRHAALFETSKPATSGPGNGQPALTSESTPPHSGKTVVSSLKAEGKGAKVDGTCDRLARTLESIRLRQRAGGSISTMESLRSDHAEIEQEQRKIGCP